MLLFALLLAPAELFHVCSHHDQVGHMSGPSGSAFLEEDCALCDMLAPAMDVVPKEGDAVPLDRMTVDPVPTLSFPGIPAAQAYAERGPPAA